MDMGTKGQWSQRGPAQYSDAPDLRGMQHKHAGRVRPIVLAACWGGGAILGMNAVPCWARLPSPGQGWEGRKPASSRWFRTKLAG